MSLHPATRILMWLAFALFLPWLGTATLALTSLILVLFLIATRNNPFVKLLRRTRWLLLSLFLVYSLATPGAELIPTLGSFSPTREGLQGGGLQTWRLAILLGGVATLLATTPGKELLAGIYYLIQPFALMGIASDRIAPRIWLTLYYAEQTLHLKPHEWQSKLRAALEGELETGQHTIQFPLEAPSPGNWLAFGIMVAIFAGLTL